MSELLSLYAPEAAPSPARQRIRRLSQPFEWLFTALTGLTVAFAVLVGVLALWPGADAIWMGKDAVWIVLDDRPPAGTIPFHALPLATQLAGAAVFALVQGALAAAFNFLRRLFHAYRGGDVFGVVPEQLLYRAGAALIAYAALPGVFQPLMRALGSPDREWLHAGTIAALLIGATLFVFARVIALGREVEREMKGFV